MNTWKFVTSDVKQILKTHKLLLVAGIFTVVFPFVFSLGVVKSRLSQTLPREAIKAIIEALAPIMVLPSAFVSAFMFTPVLDEEKAARVVEHLLLAPLSILRFLWYRSLSFAFISALLACAGGVIAYFSTMLLGLGEPLTILIAWGMVAVCAVLMTHAIVFVALLLPVKYVTIIRVLVMLSVIIMPSWISQTNVTEQSGQLYLIDVGISFVIGLLGLLVIVVLRDRLAERIMLSM